MGQCGNAESKWQGRNTQIYRQCAWITFFLRLVYQFVSPNEYLIKIVFSPFVPLTPSLSYSVALDLRWYSHFFRLLLHQLLVESYPSCIVVTDRFHWICLKNWGHFLRREEISILLTKIADNFSLIPSMERIFCGFQSLSTTFKIHGKSQNPFFSCGSEVRASRIVISATQKRRALPNARHIGRTCVYRSIGLWIWSFFVSSVPFIRPLFSYFLASLWIFTDSVFLFTDFLNVFLCTFQPHSIRAVCYVPSQEEGLCRW